MRIAHSRIGHQRMVHPRLARRWLTAVFFALAMPGPATAQGDDEVPFVEMLKSSSLREEILASRERILGDQPDARTFGAFFRCNPYCEKVTLFTDQGIALQSGIKAVPEDQLVYIAADSALFRNLYPAEAAPPPDEESAAEDIDADGEVEPHEIETTKPGFFGRHFISPSIGLFLGWSDFKVSADHDLNRDASSQFASSKIELGVELGKKRRKRFKGWRVKHGLKVSQHQSIARSSGGSEADVVSKEVGFRYEFIYERRGKALIGIIQLESDEMKATVQAPTLFSTRAEHLLLGVGYRAPRWMAEIVTNAVTRVSDDQRYRAEPFRANLVQVRVRYFVPSNIGPIKGAFIAGFGLRSYDERSGLDPVYLAVNQNVVSRQSSTMFELGYRFQY